MNTKKCGQCKEELSVDSFSKNRARSDGLQSVCKVCKKVNDAKYYRNNSKVAKDRRDTSRQKRREWLYGYKLERGCSKCGYNKCSRALHLHHTDPKNKKITPSLMIHSGWSIENMKKEVDKCEVVCANCHAEIHAGIS